MLPRDSLPSDQGFAYRFRQNSPLLATAIHAGHRVRDELLALMAISEQARRFEEDTATDLLINQCPDIVWGLDSRAEYDLNRPPEAALPLTPEKFWGVRVFAKTPGVEMNRRSMMKYRTFYDFIENHVKNILARHRFCVVFDIHSYNLARQIANGIAHPPVFNVGTAALGRRKPRRLVKAWLQALARVSIPGVKTTVAENLVFRGRGEFCRRLGALDKRVLVLPTEVAKIYMDERTGKLFPARINAIAAQLAGIVKGWEK
ncbi:MAG: N-formylglutamate amidohydrolase [Kiritimatiellae bacterium]|nr:N-formylglutamate amidohydrolase [Kiritimatiellia bacterium]